MGILIGHASLGSNGKISGDASGDQNGKEVGIRRWYNKPWNVVLRPLDSNIAEKSAKACEAGCNNTALGYDQTQRNTAHTEAKKVGYDLSKITTLCETDCSAYMTLCAIAGGVSELEYTGNAPTTRTMVNAFVKTGKYQKLTDPKYLTSDKYLKRGDILVKEGSHTAMALENGSEVTTIVTSKVTNSFPYYGVDVSSYQTNLDYTKMKNAGCQFAILKIITKDGTPDKMFEKHYAGFTKANIPVLGVYNYLYTTNVEAAKIMAGKVIKTLNGRIVPVCADIEDKVLMNLGSKLIDIINAYQKVIEDAGLPFILYTGYSFYKSYIKPYQSKLNSKNNWIARYYNGYTEMKISSKPDEAYKPDIPNLLGWQYTSSLIIDGSPSRLDGNILYRSTIVKSNTKKGVVTANSLNVRSIPNTSGAIVGYLKKGETVNILNIDATSGWYQIGNGCYVSSKYIDVI